MSKLKPILYYTFVTGWSSSGSYPIMAVTSEKPRQLFGRDEHDQGTHRRRSDCIGRFETREAALSKRQSIVDIKARFEELRRPHEEAQRVLYKQEVQEIRDHCTGLVRP